MQFENHSSDKMSQRGDYLNAEKEKLQLKHEENEFKEQIKLLRERLEHFDDPNDENSGNFGNFFTKLDHNLRLGPKWTGPKFDSAELNEKTRLDLSSDWLSDQR